MIRRLASNAALLLTVRTLSKFVVLIAVIITTRALGDARYGQFTRVVVIGSVSGIVADLGLQVVFVREASRRREELGRLLGLTLAAKLPLAVAGGLLFIGSLEAFAPDLVYLAVPAYSLVLIGGLGNVMRSCFFAEDELRYEAIAIGLETATLLIATVTVTAMHGGVAAYLWAYAVSYGGPLVYAAVVTWIRYPHITLRWEPAILLQIVQQSLPFAIAFLLTTLYFRIDVVILGQMRGDKQVGIYGAAVKFVDGLTFVPQAVMNAIFPAMSVLHKDGGDGLRQAYERAYRVLAAMGMPVSVGFVALAPAIIRYTRVFPASATSLRILGISMFFIFVVNSFIYVLGAMNKQTVFVVLTAISVVVNVVLNFVVIPLFPGDRGYEATSWTTVFSEVLLFVIGYVALRRAMGPFDWLRPIAPVLVSGATMMAIMWPLQDHPFVSAVVGPLMYLAVMLRTGGISRGEIRLARELVRGGR